MAVIALMIAFAWVLKWFVGFDLSSEGMNDDSTEDGVGVVGRDIDEEIT